MDNAKIILTTTSSFAQNAPERLESLQNQGFQIVCNPKGRKLTEEEVLELLRNNRPVGLLAGTEPITRKVLQEARDYLRVISRVGMGWENVDRKTASDLGIIVYRTLGVLDQAVAELTVGLILAALRSISLQDKKLRQGLWEKRMGKLLQGKVVGIIGFGAIGRRVGKLLRAFGTTLIYCDLKSGKVRWAQRVPLPQLLQQADIITIHDSGREKILGPEELEILGRRDVILVNTARGELVDETALCSGLKEGRLRYACLDVFAEEPYQGPLCRLDNVILTPHVGSYALEARQLMEEAAIENLLHGLEETNVL